MKAADIYPFYEVSFQDVLLFTKGRSSCVMIRCMTVDRVTSKIECCVLDFILIFSV